MNLVSVRAWIGIHDAHTTFWTCTEVLTLLTSDKHNYQNDQHKNYTHKNLR